LWYQFPQCGEKHDEDWLAANLDLGGPGEAVEVGIGLTLGGERGCRNLRGHEHVCSGLERDRIRALLAEEALDYLKAPVVRVGGFGIPFPYVHENLYMPTVPRVLKAIQKVAQH
jgi:hypothetical protein